MSLRADAGAEEIGPRQRVAEGRLTQERADTIYNSIKTNRQTVMEQGTPRWVKMLVPVSDRKWHG